MKSNHIALLFAILNVFACGGKAADIGTPKETSVGGHASTGGTSSVERIDAGGESAVATTVVATGGSSVVESPSTGGMNATGGSSSTKPACGPYVVSGVQSGESIVATVGSYLEFNLNPNSPSGTISSGFQPVITIDATAHCGDIELDKVMFQVISESAGGMSWIWNLVKINTGISYTLNGTPVLHSYGPDAQSQPENAITGVYWDHTFAQKIVIKDGKTFTFSLKIPFDDLHLPFGTVRFNLYGSATWKGLDQPEAYPDNISFKTIVGNTLTYRGTINGPTSYCDEAMGTSYFGYRGCCGMYETSEGVPPAGSLIKGSSSYVYYLGKNGKRYIFPTSQVLDSWFGPLNWDKSYDDYYQSSSKPFLYPLENPAICNAVKQVTDSVLASIPLGGNVTMRPGTYITGITADPKRYVIAQGGVLRNIVDVNVAASLFGSDIATMTFGPLEQSKLPVRLNHDAFFLDYSIGAPVAASSDYDWSTERSTASLEKSFGAE